MKRIAIVAALPGELKPLVAGWAHERRGPVHLWRSRSGSYDCVAACGGAGPIAAARVLNELGKEAAFDLVMSVGWCGALRPEFETGHAYAVAGVIDRLTGERFFGSIAAGDSPWLVTIDQVAGVAEKQALARAHAAGLVDMEASTVARWAAARSVPFAGVKAVSDGPDDALPDFNPFITAEGQFLVGRFVRFALLRPHLWPALLRMGRNSAAAARALGKNLGDLLTQQGNMF